MYGEQAVYDGGLHVHTAMDPLHQRAAEYALRAGLNEADHRRGWRGPVEQLPASEYDAFLKKQKFTPQSLDNAGWAKALVTKVTKDGAEARLGDYKGYIGVRTMGWCRTPNPRVAAASSRVTPS